MASETLRAWRIEVLNGIQPELYGIASSLFAMKLISKEVFDKALNLNISSAEKGVTLLDCIESRIEVVPSDFARFVLVLEEQRYMMNLTQELIKTYCKLYYIMNLLHYFLT